MFKVSFKETESNPSRVVLKKGKSTIVTLRGTAKLPSFWSHIPEDIAEWVRCRTRVELYEDMVNNKLLIFAEGMSKCHEDDKYDSLLGERLADARAKYNVYKFFYDLCSKLEGYYSNILYGPCGVADSGSGNCIAQDLKKYEALCIREAHHIGELLKNKENG